MSYCKTANKVVRPIMSSDFCEARRRALGLYKAFYRFIPVLLRRFDIPKNENDCRCMIRAYFYKNACLTDIRIIDVLVMKGYMELQELTENFQQKGHVMRHWNPTAEPKPLCFLEKFVAGTD